VVPFHQPNLLQKAKQHAHPPPPPVKVKMKKKTENAIACFTTSIKLGNVGQNRAPRPATQSHRWRGSKREEETQR
jgi:hypothetical protein